MSSDVEIKIGLDIEPNADSLRKLQSEIKKSSEVTLRHGQIGTGTVSGMGAGGQAAASQIAATASKLFAVTNVVTGTVAGFTGLYESARKLDSAIIKLQDSLYGLTENAQKAVHLEEARAKILQLQLDYTKKQLDTQLQFKAALFEAQAKTEEFERMHAKGQAERNKKLADDISDLDTQKGKRDAKNEQAILDLLYTINSSSNAWWSKGKGGQADVFDIHNMRSFIDNLGLAVGSVSEITQEIDGFRVVVQRASDGIQTYEQGGIRVYDRQGNLYSENQFMDSGNAVNIVNATIANLLKIESQKERNEKGNTITGNKEKEDRRWEIITKQAKARLEYEKDRIILLDTYREKSMSMIQDVSRLQTTVDATVYALRRKKLADEHVAELAYIEEVKKERDLAAKEGREIDFKTMAELQRHRDEKIRRAQVSFDVNSSVNEMLTPNNLGGIYGDQENAARLQRAREMQRALLFRTIEGKNCWDFWHNSNGVVIEWSHEWNVIDNISQYGKDCLQS